MVGSALLNCQNKQVHKSKRTHGRRVQLRGSKQIQKTFFNKSTSSIQLEVLKREEEFYDSGDDGGGNSG
jgi:hypothetical protein